MKLGKSVLPLHCISVVQYQAMPLLYGIILSATFSTQPFGCKAQNKPDLQTVHTEQHRCSIGAATGAAGQQATVRYGPGPTTTGGPSSGFQGDILGSLQFRR